MRMIRNIIFMVMLCMMLSSCDILLGAFLSSDQESTDINIEDPLNRNGKKQKKVKKKLDAAYPSLGN